MGRMDTGRMLVVPREGIKGEFFYRPRLVSSCSKDVFFFSLLHFFRLHGRFLLSDGVDVLRRFDNYILAVGFGRC